jgi:hypothetical protein
MMAVSPFDHTVQLDRAGFGVTERLAVQGGPVGDLNGR